MVDQQTAIPVELKSEEESSVSVKPTTQSSTNTGFKAIVDEVVKDTKLISAGVKKLPKKRKIMLYAGIALMAAVILSLFNYYFYIVFGLFIPFGYGMAIVMSSYTGKDLLDEMEKNKQKKKSVQKVHIGKVEIHEEDKIHETH